MEAHRCHHKVCFFPLQCFLAKSKDKIPKICLQKETKLLLKIIPECTKSHRLFKNFPGGGGGGGGGGGDAPRTPLRWLCPYGARNRALGAQFLPHQPRIDGYASVIDPYLSTTKAFNTTIKLLGYTMWLKLRFALSLPFNGFVNIDFLLKYFTLFSFVNLICTRKKWNSHLFK